jgi:DNA invertase Pin-like site-specific DNA recombinase
MIRLRRRHRAEAIGVRKHQARAREAIEKVFNIAFPHGLSGVAQFENEVRSQRQRAGIAAAREAEKLRSVEVLERIASLEASRLLEALATSAPQSILTIEAKASLTVMIQR